MGAEDENKATMGMQAPLLGCCSDCGGCCFTSYFPCCVNAAIAARVDERPCTPCDLLSNGYQSRQTLRAKYDMGFDPWMDCLSMWLCGCCFTIQTVKEIALKQGGAPVYCGSVQPNGMAGRG